MKIIQLQVIQLLDISISWYCREVKPLNGRFFSGSCPFKNSLVKKSGIKLFFPIINSMVNSKHDNKLFQRVKIYLETKLLTSFFQNSFADLQSILE